MKIYENANDQHVRKVVLYEVEVGLAFDKEGTELLTKEQIIDAFLKGCVVENEGNYKVPTGCNATGTKAELVFCGEGGSGGVIVHFELDKEGDAAVADKTPSEVMQLMNEGVLVYGYLTITEEEGSMSVNLGAPMLDLESLAIGFAPSVYDGNMTYFIIANDDGWKVNGL